MIRFMKDTKRANLPTRSEYRSIMRKLRLQLRSFHLHRAAWRDLADLIKRGLIEPWPGWNV
jgi:hypothetical protein